MNTSLDHPPSGFRLFIRNYVLPVLLAILVAVLLRAFVFQSYVVVSGSMQPTLTIGQRVATQRLIITPALGDIVVFTPIDAPPPEHGLTALTQVLANPFTDSSDTPDVLIKRVIALGGQTVSVTDDVLYVDGAPQPDSFAQPPTYDFGPVLIPEGYFFAMGDNRMGSLDSRTFGPVPMSHITAVMMFRF